MNTCIPSSETSDKMDNTLPSSSVRSDYHQYPLTSNETFTLCEQFASITSTNTDIAMVVLQENEWNLEQAINLYLDKPKSIFEKIDGRHPTSEVSKKKTQFKLLSWNIDGLDKHELEARTWGVIEIIKSEAPDAVFLQEVLPQTFELIQTCLPDYQGYAGDYKDYFVVILTRREMFKIHGFEIIAYPGTIMNRNLLILHTTYNNSIDIDFMTSHHESGAQEFTSNERMEQLKLCFQRMITAPSDRIVLFGGDLNMRERELQQIGNIPIGIGDLWIETGKREECRYTWDMMINTNNYFPSDTSRPRARFDRLYYRSSNRSDVKFHPTHFELKGLEKLPSSQRFCSDHWAIQSYFHL